MEHLGYRSSSFELNMPADYVRKLVELAQPLEPVEQPQPQDWANVEHDLGAGLAPDYKALVSALGSGDFGAGLTLSNPVSSSEYTRLSARALGRYREAVYFIEDRAGIALFPRPKGLVLVGGIDRKQLLFGPAEDGRTLSNLTALDHDLEQAWRIQMTLSHFLHDLYLGRLRDHWAEELRRSVWMNGTAPFFNSAPGHKSEPQGT